MNTQMNIDSWDWDLTEDVSMGRRYGHQKYIQNNDVYPMVHDNTLINILAVISIISSIIGSLR
jgi:hypothetical protein